MFGMNRVAFVGGVTLDVLATVQSFPPPDSRSLIAQPVWSVGGPATVAGLAYARLMGATDIAVFSCVGRDIVGEFLMQRLSAAQIPWMGQQIANQMSSTSIVISDSDGGTRTILTHPCALTAQTIAKLIEALAQWKPDWVQVDGYWPKLSLAVIRWAQKHGAFVSIDLSHVRGTMIAHLATDTQICIADDATARQLGDDPQDVLAQFAAWNVAVGGVTQGALGCFIGTALTSIHVPAPAVAVLDTTGAGDVFHGAFLAAFISSGDYHTAARWATAAASLSTMTIGSSMNYLTSQRVAEIADTLTERML